MKNRLLKFLCKILPVKKHAVGEKRRILVVSTTGLGDTLWATPTIESLRRSFPDSYLAALTSPLGNDVLKTNPRLDSIHVIKEPLFFRFLSFWRTLYRERFDTVLILHASQRLVFPLCSLIGATHVLGTHGINKGLDSLLTKALFPQYEHEILRRLRMVEEIGGKIHSEKLSFFLENRTPLLPEGKWIAIHPGSKDGFKRWPAKNFIELGKALKASIVVTGTRAEKPLIEKVASQIPGAIKYEIEALHDFAKILNQAALLISNDTGSVHLACALDREVIALYGPTDPHLCGPHKARAVVMSAKPTCTPCIKRKCQEPFCLRQIGVNEVLSQVPQ